MRMLYIANSRLPTEKAHGLQIMKTIEAFMHAGVDVVLVAPRRRNPITVSIKEFYGLSLLPKIIHVPNWAGLLERSFKRAYFVVQRATFAVSAFVLALASHCDVIYSRDITICFFLSCLGKPVIFEDHEPKNRWRWIYRYFIRRIPKKVIVARNLAELYAAAKVRAGSYEFAPNGVDVEAFTRVVPDAGIWKDAGVPHGSMVALYVGHFYRWKGVYDLLDASRSLDCHTVLIGGTPEDQAAVSAYITDHKLTRAHLLPFVLHDRIIAYIKSADVLVLPNTATEERSNAYTTPLKLFEYLASGVPLIATKIPSFGAYLRDGENSFMCPPDDPQALAERIRFVLGHPFEARQAAAKGLNEAHAYSWDERARTILKFIQA